MALKSPCPKILIETCLFDTIVECELDLSGEDTKLSLCNSLTSTVISIQESNRFLGPALARKIAADILINVLLASKETNFIVNGELIDTSIN